MAGSWRGVMSGVPMEKERRLALKVALEKLKVNPGPYSPGKFWGDYKDKTKWWGPTQLIKLENLDIIERAPEDGIYTLKNRKMIFLKYREKLDEFLPLLDIEDEKIIKYGFGKDFELTSELKNYLDGLILGDACYKIKDLKDGSRGMSATLDISQRYDHEDWLRNIESFLVKNMIEVGPFTYSEGGPREIAGKTTVSAPSYCLHTHVYRTFEREHARWYKLNPEWPNCKPRHKYIKIIPKDIDITSPLLLSQWYLGDGSISMNYASGGMIRFSTDCFNFEEVDFLKKLFLDKLGFHATIKVKEKQYPILALNTTNEIKSFLKIVEPYVVSSYNYKTDSRNKVEKSA